MTPNDIEILLHYHCCAEEHPRIMAPAVTETVRWAIDEGLLVCREQLTKYGSSYQTTERGKVLIEAWCSQPLPEQAWIIPERPKAPQ